MYELMACVDSFPLAWNLPFHNLFATFFFFFILFPFFYPKYIQSFSLHLSRHLFYVHSNGDLMTEYACAELLLYSMSLVTGNAYLSGAWELTAGHSARVAKCSRTSSIPKSESCLVGGGYYSVQEKITVMFIWSYLCSPGRKNIKIIFSQCKGDPVSTKNLSRQNFIEATLFI